jgi:hypothetical protein
MACFVWLRGLRGPTAEIWRDHHIDVYRNRLKLRTLSFRELTSSEAGEPIDRLAGKYPPPESEE